MRLALVLVLSLVMSGCAVLRKDREEPVENGPRQPKAEPVLKPSEALKPESTEIPSPISDHFYFRGTYFQPTVETIFRLDASSTDPGTELSAEEDLGLDDQANQARIEFDVRMADKHHMRVDYFKLNRFNQVNLANPIEFGDFDYAAGTLFRTKLDWRVFSLTYTYSFFKFERFEAGLGIGIHVIQAQAEGGEPGTLRRERSSEVGIFPTIAANAAFRISKRWSITARGQSFSASPDEFDGTMSDYHADLQFRPWPNLAFGLGYTMLETDLMVFDTDQPLLFNLDTSGPELFFRVSF